MARESSHSGGGGGRGTEARDSDAWVSGQSRGRRGADSIDDDDVSEVDEPSAADDVRVLVLELQSSIAFGVASALLVPSSPLVRALAGCLLLLHVVPEMCVDCSRSLPPRTAAHGRYLATDHPGDDGASVNDSGGCGCGCQHPQQRRRWNQVQSLVFATASLAQALAYGFLLQVKRQEWALDAYLVLVLAAAALWMASGLLVVASFASAATTRRTTSRRAVGRTRWCGRMGEFGGFVLAGNVLYLLGCVCWLPAAVNQYRSYNEAFLGAFLQQLAAGLWAAAALMFLASDGGRLCCQGRDRTKRQRFGPSATLDAGGRRNGERAAGGGGEDQVQETSSSSGDGDDGA
jgi:hypothetical protein